MIKKLTAAVIAAAMITALLFTCAVSADGLKDIETSAQKRAIEALYSLNLVYGDENGNFNPESSVTRTEFLAMVSRMIGQENAATSLENEALPFTDVPAEHWGRKYIYFAWKMGIVNGMSETQFAPDSTVTYHQAVKMIVCALGYGIAAERKGGYPSGYLAQAISLDLTEGVKAQERVLKREEAARLILNGVTVPMLELLNDEYTETETPLEIMGYKKYNGVVTSTYEAQTTDKELDENRVEISGIVYETTYYAEAELLGAPVIYYTETDGSDETVRYIHRRYDSSVLEVDAHNILDTTTLTEFYYTENSKIRKTSLPGSSLTVVYNGKLAGSGYYENGAILRPESGFVSLRDSDNNSVYDIAVVNDFTTVVVSGKSENDIFDKYGNSVELEDAEGQVSIYKDGRRVSLWDIESGDVLSVAQSKDKSKVIAYITNESVGGTVKSRSEENGRTWYEIETVNGEVKELCLAPQYLAAQRANRTAAVKFDLGDSGVFYLNYMGEIAYSVLTEKNDEMTYGYIVNAATRGGLGNKSEFRMLTLDNKFTAFEAEEQIYFGRMSGSSYVRSRESSSVAVSYLTGGVEFAHQICSYKLNDEGKITELQLADTGGGSEEHLTLFVEKQSLDYSQMLLNQKYIVNQDTVVFYIPHSAEYEDVLSVGKYSSYLRNGKVLAACYDIKNNHVGALVYAPITIERYDSGAGEYETIIDNVNSPVLYIQSVTYTKGDDDEYYMSVTGIEDGEIVQVKVADALSGISDDKSLLKPGVAIQYEMNDLTRSRALTSDEEAVMIVFKTVYDFNKDQPMGQNYNYASSYQVRPQISVIHSKVSAIEPSFIGVELGNKAAPLSGGSVYMRYDADSKEKFELIDRAQISIGQEIVLRLRYLSTREAVVIK